MEIIAGAAVAVFATTCLMMIDGWTENDECRSPNAESMTNFK